LGFSKRSKRYAGYACAALRAARAPGAVDRAAQPPFRLRRAEAVERDERNET